MHPNLEKRFINLAAQRCTYLVHLEAFRTRYHLLFDALVLELGCTPEALAAELGLGGPPCAETTDTTTDDCIRLLERYLEHSLKRETA